MKLFIQWGNSSECSYNNKKMALHAGETREADGYYFLLLLELIILIIMSKSRFFPAQENSSILLHSHLLLLHKTHKGKGKLNYTC